MAKDTFYFSHDYNSRNDEKIKALLFKHGFRGYGIFWAIIEDLYNNANALQLDECRIAYELREDESVVKSVIHDFNLFVFDGNIFGSKSVEKRLNDRDKKSATARKSAYKRWGKGKDANALRTGCERNAIKERKVKEKKESKVKERIVVPPFDSVVFKECWQSWKDYKHTQHRFTYKSPESEQAALIDLAEISKGIESNAIKIIKQSIAKGWKGLFELKNEKNGNTVTASSLQQALNRRFEQQDGGGEQIVNDAYKRAG